MNYVKALIIIFIAAIFLIPVSINASHIAFDDPESLGYERGTIAADGKVFHFEKTYFWLKIYDAHDYLQFQWDVEDRDTVLKGFDYSERRQEFVIFTETFDPEARVYTLAMRGSSLYVLVTDRSEKTSYSPILIEEKNVAETVVYIEEGAKLVSFDPAKKMVLEREAFDKPIFDLGKQKIEGIDHLTFKQLDRGVVRSFKRRFQRTAPHKHPIVPMKQRDEFEAQLPHEGEAGESPIDYPLNPRAILGFGDSITYGKIWADLVPHLGYVPRLELLVNEQLFPGGDSYVINEGNPGETIHAYPEKLRDRPDKIATLRYKGVLENHLAKYLLLHEGTNDTRFYDYDLQLVYNDLQWMVDLALDMGIQPVLSTLIPKDIDYYPSVRSLDLERGRKISVFIRTLGKELDLPVVDFWEIFSNHPDGYKSLMSDYVHPNEKGYQLIAEEWLKALQGLEGPLTPAGIEIIEATPSRITIQWDDNTAGDFSHYVLEYGFAEDSLDRVVELADAYYTFYYNILQSPFRSRIYFRLQAVDKAGKSSPFSQVHTAAFLTFSH